MDRKSARSNRKHQKSKNHLSLWERWGIEGQTLADFDFVTEAEEEEETALAEADPPMSPSEDIIDSPISPTTANIMAESDIKLNSKSKNDPVKDPEGEES